MTVAIVPAAGRSSRMGRPKLLLPYGDTTVLGATVAALRAGGARELVLVVAPDDAALRDWAAANGVRSTVNPRPDDGMLTSICAGLQALGGAEAILASGEELLVCPGDLPRLRGDTVAGLVHEARSTQCGLLVPRCGKERGHPLVVRGELLREIPRLDPEVGLRQLRLLHPQLTVEVEVADPGAVQDVDTPQDYERLLG